MVIKQCSAEVCGWNLPVKRAARAGEAECLLEVGHEQKAEIKCFREVQLPTKYCENN